MACFFDWPDCFLLASGQCRRPPSFLASQLPFLTSSLRRQVRVVRSYQSSSHLLRRLGLIRALLTSSAASSPASYSKCQIAVGTAPPQPQVPDRSGRYRASTASARSPDRSGQSGPTAIARSQWALPHLSRKCQIAVGGIPGLSQIARSQWAVSGPTAIARSQWALPHLSRKCQIAVGATGPQQQAPDRQIAVGSLGPHRNRQIAVGTTRPQQQAPDHK